MTIRTIFTPAELISVSALLVLVPGCGLDVQEPGGGAAGSGGLASNGSGGLVGVNQSGGAASGGSPASGSGGMNNSASGGAASATGGAGSGGTDGTSDAPMPSSGCGQAAPQEGNATIDVAGLTREYILALPDDYDPSKPYKLIFTFHPWGGSAQQVAGNGPSGYYGLRSISAGEAILVSPEGLDFRGNGLGWGNEGGQDLDFVQAMLDRFDAELCFDHSRIFSTGFSFGGMMSNAVACAGIARAVAPMAGNSSVSGCESGSTPVAYMGFHGDADSVVGIEGGEMARDVFVQRNGCGAATPSDSDWCDLAGANYQPCECTTYEGCTDGYPVTWCEFSGNHMVAPNSAQTIWDFFAQF